MSGSTNTPFPLGVYLGTPDPGDAAGNAIYEASLNSFTSLMGTPPAFVTVFTDYTQSISDWASNASWEAWSVAQTAGLQSVTPVIGLALASVAAGSGTSDQQFKAFASGQYDSEIQGVVQSWAAQGFKNLDFRVGMEMNLPGAAYAGDDPQSQADWVAAFQHVYTTLHQVAAADGVNVQVIWNPSVTNYSNVATTTTLYPGNDYVDIIGADAYAAVIPYSDYPGTTLYHDWATGGTDTSLAQFMANPVNLDHYWSYPAGSVWGNDVSGGHNESLTDFIQFAEQQGKPFAIPETSAGSSNAGNDVNDDSAYPAWLSAQLTAAEAQGLDVSFVNLWDNNAGSNYEFSFASDNKPNEAAAWAQYFGAQASTESATSSSTVLTSAADSASINVTASGTTTSIDGTTTGTTQVDDDTIVLTASGVATATLGSTSSSLAFIGMSSIALTGSTADAVVTADGGNNTFTAGQGALEVTGGTGADAYVFGAGDGNLTIDDFSASKGDTLTIDSGLQGSMQQSSDNAGGMLLTFQGAGSIDLKNATAAINWS